MADNLYGRVVRPEPARDSVYADFSYFKKGEGIPAPERFPVWLEFTFSEGQVSVYSVTSDMVRAKHGQYLADNFLTLPPEVTFKYKLRIDHRTYIRY